MVETFYYKMQPTPHAKLLMIPEFNETADDFNKIADNSGNTFFFNISS